VDRNAWVAQKPVIYFNRERRCWTCQDRSTLNLGEFDGDTPRAAWDAWQHNPEYRMHLLRHARLRRRVKVRLHQNEDNYELAA
jgi:hypothetical protein